MYHVNTHIKKWAKLNWGLKQEALNTMYKVAIQPLLLYGAPVWVRAIDKTSTDLYTAEYNGSWT